jgi:hypothetical protein
MTLFRSWALACALAAALGVPAVRAQEKCTDCTTPNQDSESTATPVLQCWLSFGTLDLPKPERNCSPFHTMFEGPFVFALRPQIAPFLPPCTLMVQVSPPPPRPQLIVELLKQYRSCVTRGEQGEAVQAATKALELDPNCGWANAARKSAYTADCDAKINRCLGAPISVNFQDAPLCQCIEDLGQMTGLNIVLDLRSLREDGIDVQSPVTMKLEDVSLRAALGVLLHQVHAVYVVKDGAVQVTTEQEARGKPVARTYPIGDLLILPLNAFEGYAECADQTSRIGRSVVKLITATISPQTWAENGGCGSIDYFPVGKALVIYQTADVQEQIADLLAALRRVQEKLNSPAEQTTPSVECLQHPPQYCPETPAYSLTKELAAQEATAPPATPDCPAPTYGSAPSCWGSCTGMMTAPCCSTHGCNPTPCPACSQGCAGSCTAAGCCPACSAKKTKHGHSHSFVPVLMVPWPPMMPFSGPVPPCPALPDMSYASGVPVMMMPPPPAPMDAPFAVPPAPPCMPAPPAYVYEMRGQACTGMASLTGAPGDLVVHAGKEALRIRGASLSGSCTHVTFSTAHGACFEGHVHLKQEGDGQHIEVSAERGCVCCKDGHIEMCAGNPAWICFPAGYVGPASMAPSPGSWDLEKAETGIHIRSMTLEGTCERVTVSEHGDSMMLEGHVHLKCHNDDQQAKLSADHVRIYLTDGSLQLTWPTPQAATVPYITTNGTPISAPQPLCPPSIAPVPPTNSHSGY